MHKTLIFGEFYALEWTRNTTDHTVHRALNHYSPTPYASAQVQIVRYVRIYGRIARNDLRQRCVMRRVLILMLLHRDANNALTMSKVRTTLTIDESVMRAVKMHAARTGRGDSQVIEDSLRRDLGLDLLERLWEHNDLSEREATALAVEAQHQTRRRRR